MLIILLIKKHPYCGCFQSLPGSVLLSQGVAPQLSSALKSLTSVFGMGTGVTSSLSSPDIENIVLSKLNNREEIECITEAPTYLC